jgi:hypothetical protein
MSIPSGAEGSQPKEDLGERTLARAGAIEMTKINSTQLLSCKIHISYF